MAALRPLLIAALLLSFLYLGSSDSEWESLLKLKASFTNVGALGSWVADSSPCKNNWVGIICFDGVITGLHLSDLGLSGKIDVEAVLSLQNLRTISFVNNSFTGPIPDFHRIGALKALLLSRNGFSGEIPADYFKSMASMKKVWLSDNNFSGPIPDSLTQLNNLLELHLERNQFSGRIPAIGGEKLTSLDLSNNKLEGEIPAGLAKFGSNSFNGNDGLCGNPLNVACSTANPNPNPPGEAEKSSHSQVIIFSILGLLVVGTILIVLRSSRRREVEFSVLGKEVVHEAIEVHVSSSRQSSRASSSRKGGSVSKRGSRGKHDDLIMVSVDRGVFGLSDLMKATAEVLGNGGIGSAYKAVMANGLAVVVKRLREMNRLDKNEFDAEMRRLGGLRHGNISPPLAYHFRPEEKLLVYEYAANSSLLYVLHGDRGVCHAELTWPIRLKIIQGVARGLGFLHTEFSSYDLPHGNLKSSNILLDASYEPLLCDYAFHPLISPTQVTNAMFAYRAPEYLQHQQVSPKCDVYSLGIVILEILTGKFPSQYLSNGKGGTDVVQWVRSAISEKREDEVINPEIASTSSDSRNQMVRMLHIGASCTESDPEKRINLREAIRSIEDVKV